MFKGIIALFTSGLIFHPMILGGIISAVIVSFNWENEEIYAILRTSYLYIGIFALALAYTFIFAKVYKEGGEEVNQFATFIRTLGNTVKFTLAFLLTFSFMMMISF